MKGDEKLSVADILILRDKAWAVVAAEETKSRIIADFDEALQRCAANGTLVVENGVTYLTDTRYKPKA